MSNSLSMEELMEKLSVWSQGKHLDQMVPPGNHLKSCESSVNFQKWDTPKQAQFIQTDLSIEYPESSLWILDNNKTQQRNYGEG